jgi:hypothetical protein
MYKLIDFKIYIFLFLVNGACNFVTVYGNPGLDGNIQPKNVNFIFLCYRSSCLELWASNSKLWIGNLGNMIPKLWITLILY